MDTKDKTLLTVKTEIKASPTEVWKFWTEPQHIVGYYNASPDWHTPKAENDLRVGGKFNFRMEAKDESTGFDYEGEYLEIENQKLITYVLGDGREVKIVFEEQDGATQIKETFEAENTFSLEKQQEGWQSILDNFKSYVESKSGSGKFETLKMEINIHSTGEKVYETMLDKKHYEQWTALFSEGSTYEGSWEKGSKILFLAPDKNGEMSGMVSRIKENIPNQFVSIEHLGIVKNGQEITSGPDVEPWSGCLENYTFEEENDQTKVKVAMEAEPAHKEYFEETWPKALQKLKEICEAEK